MNILITGGTGFIGSHLVTALLKAGHHVTTLSRRGEFAFPISTAEFDSNLRIVRGDINDRLLLTGLIKTADILIHNASVVGAQGASEFSREYTDTNVGGTNCVAHILTETNHSIRHVIAGSSISVYGEGNYDCAKCGIVRPAVRRKDNWKEELGWNPQCPTCAGDILPSSTPETALRNGEHLYAVTKKYQEDLLTLAANTTGIPLTMFRYATIYGSGQRRRNPYMEMLMNLSCGIPPVIFEDGMQTREFVDVSDVVRANLLALIPTSPSVRVFNIGSGTPRHLIDFVRHMSSKFASLSGQPLINPIIKQSLYPGDVRHCTLDCSAALNELGFQAEVGMEEGADQFLSWYVESNSSGKADVLTA